MMRKMLNLELFESATLDEILLKSCETGDLKRVEELIYRGADINTTDDKGCTPLMKACKYNNLEVVKYLIDNGANIHMKCDNGWTPLICAQAYDNLEIVEYLKSKIEN